MFTNIPNEILNEFSRLIDAEPAIGKVTYPRLLYHS